jgi:hypothetical protein
VLLAEVRSSVGQNINLGRQGTLRAVPTCRITPRLPTILFGGTTVWRAGCRRVTLLYWTQFNNCATASTLALHCVIAAPAVITADTEQNGLYVGGRRSDLRIRLTA